MKIKKDSFGIYERGHGSYHETMNYWGEQREGIALRLKRFADNTQRLKEAWDIIEQAKKNNPNNLPF